MTSSTKRSELGDSPPRIQLSLNDWNREMNLKLEHIWNSSKSLEEMTKRISEYMVTQEKYVSELYIDVQYYHQSPVRNYPRPSHHPSLDGYLFGGIEIKRIDLEMDPIFDEEDHLEWSGPVGEKKEVSGS